MNVTTTYRLIVLSLYLIQDFRHKLVLANPNPSSSSSSSTPPTSDQPQSNNTSVTKVALDIKSDKQATEQFDYEKNDSAKTATYTCKEGHGFSSVKQDNTEIWKATGNEYAEKVFLQDADDAKLTVDIHFPDQTKRVFTKSGSTNPWIETDQSELDSNDLPSEVKITTEDSDGKISENDITKYNAIKLDGEDLYEYIFNSGVKCTKVKHLDKRVWKYETAGTDSEGTPTTPAVSGTASYPKSIKYNKKDGKITLLFDSDQTTYALNTNGKWKLASSTMPLGPPQHPEVIKVTTLRTNGKTKENDTNKYKVYKREDIYTYIFKPGARCIMIKHNDNEVWKHDSTDHSESGSTESSSKQSTGSQDSDRTSDLYPDSFTYNKSDNTFVLYFGLEFVKYTLDSTTSTWTGTAIQPLVKVTTEGSTNENDTTKYNIYKLDGPDLLTYVFNDGVNCTSITHLGNELWKREKQPEIKRTRVDSDHSDDDSDDSDYNRNTKPVDQPLHFFTYNKRDNKLTLWFGLEYIKYNLDTADGIWERGKILESKLDIENDKKSTTEFDYLHNNDTKTTTYTCKEEFGFTQVKQGDTQIWKANGNTTKGQGPTSTPTTKSQHANRVVLSDPASDTATLTIHFLDGTKKLFKKSSTDQQWNFAKQTGSLPLEQNYLPKPTISSSTTVTQTSNQPATQTTNKSNIQTTRHRVVQVTYTYYNPSDPNDASQYSHHPLYDPNSPDINEATEQPVDLPTHTPVATPTDTHTPLCIDTGDGKMVTIGSPASAVPTEIILKEGKGTREIRVLYSNGTDATADVTHDLTGDEDGHPYGIDEFEYSSDDVEGYTDHSGEALSGKVIYSDHMEDVHLHSDTDVHVHGDPAKRGTAPVPSRGRSRTQRGTHAPGETATRSRGQPGVRVTGEPSHTKVKAETANPSRKKTGGGHSATRATHPRQTNR